jgi:hypothetical protein
VPVPRRISIPLRNPNLARPGASALWNDLDAHSRALVIVTAFDY